MNFEYALLCVADANAFFFTPHHLIQLGRVTLTMMLSVICEQKSIAWAPCVHADL